MDTLAGIVPPIVLLGIVVLVPLSVLRSLDEIKAGQRPIEHRLADLEARIGGAYDRV